MTAQSPTITRDICLVSREGVCLLDMKQVAESAKQLGLTGLADLIEADLSENRILDGQYLPAIKNVLGMQI